MGLKVLFDDITKLTVDAVVNSTKGDFMITRNLDRVIEAEEEVRKQIRMSMPDKMFEL